MQRDCIRTVADMICSMSSTRLVDNGVRYVYNSDFAFCCATKVTEEFNRALFWIGHSIEVFEWYSCCHDIPSLLD